MWSNLSTEELTNKITETIKKVEFIKSTEVIGKFINIKLNYSKIVPIIFEEITNLNATFGAFRDDNPIVIVIDYSASNVAKNMTAAHLRSTIIGQSLMHIHEFSGNIPFGINHIGDWGTQFGQIIYQYKKEFEENGNNFTEELHKNPTVTLMKIYRDFNENIEKDPSSTKTAQQIFFDLEQGNEEYIKLWEQFRKWSLDEFEEIYKLLNIKFDSIQGESFYEDRISQAIEEGLNKNVLKKDDKGSVIFPSQLLVDPVTGVKNDKIMINHEGKEKNEIIVKPNGGSVYLTRDIAAIRYRIKDLGAEKILYVIGKEQTNHLLELFAISDQLDYAKLGQALQVTNGHLNISGKKMKSREGKVILLKDIINDSIKAAKDMLINRKKKNDSSEKLTDQEDEIAMKVGISSVIFNDLKQSREKDIEFDPDFAKTVEAGSSAYIQYTNARLNSLINKIPDGIADYSKNIEDDLLNPNEKLLIFMLSQFPKIVSESAQTNHPHKIATYLTEICQLFNLIYAEIPILKEENESLKQFRLKLVYSAKQVIENASKLLLIQLPEKM
ncbi:MAG TPA: arginine--tRNA ligase [Patescibacteria group bacterium]|nr:arginine--tRNA ligase [Patescibacteria group bacterium]